MMKIMDLWIEELNNRWEFLDYVPENMLLFKENIGE